MVILWSPQLVAKELPCDAEGNPEVCAFLQRYLNDLYHYDNPDLPLQQKLRDDKFIIIDGALENIPLIDSTAAFSLQRYDYKAYEAIWSSPSGVLLHVAFPIQYELILGKTQMEMEPLLQDFIYQAPPFDDWQMPELAEQPDADGIYHSVPNAYYELPSLSTTMYFFRRDTYVPVMDEAYPDYSLSNLFLFPVDSIDCIIQVQQPIYGFQQLNYTIRLSQWLRYCHQQQLTSYVAIEEETDEAWKLLIVAESKELAYNHLLSVWVPKTFFSSRTVTLLAKINAFIPTHNVKDLYDQYRQTKKHVIE